jgi:hypothetical protein
MYTDTATEKTNKKRRNMGFCFLNGGLSPISATTAGLSSTAIGGIVAGTVGGGLVLGTVLRGGNPSPNN